MRHGTQRKKARKAEVYEDFASMALPLIRAYQFIQPNPPLLKFDPI